MAVAALAGQDLPQPAEVFYGYAGPLKASAWQVGTECYVPATETRAWGWTVTLSRYDAKIDAYGRTVRVPFRIQGGKEVLPLSQVAKQLGAACGWRQGTGKFDVWSELNSVEVTEGGLLVEAKFPIKVYVSYLNEPPRSVLDIYGAKLDSMTEVKLPANARISQFKPDVVRVTVETELKFKNISELIAPRRSLEAVLEAGPADLKSAQDLAAPLRPPPDQDPTAPIIIEPGSKLVDPPLPVDNSINAGPVALLEEGPVVSILRLPVGKALKAPAQVSRPVPDEIHILLPGARYVPAELPFPEGSAVQEVNAVEQPDGVVVALKLKRPMGLEFSLEGNDVRLMLIKPEVGNGKLAGKIVVVDAGHGGHDAGARSPDKKTQEKDLTLKIATKVASMLASEGATVIMTRKTDVFIPLKERSEIANRNGADFFISCHINSSQRPNKSSGQITFHHAKDPIGILLAECIQREIAKVGQLPNLGVWSDQKIYTSGFAVLRYAKMPAVLLELGFINHTKDRGRMTTATFPNDIARAVVRGLKVYLGDAKA